MILISFSLDSSGFASGGRDVSEGECQKEKEAYILTSCNREDTPSSSNPREPAYLLGMCRSTLSQMMPAIAFLDKSASITRKRLGSLRASCR